MNLKIKLTLIAALLFNVVLFAQGGITVKGTVVSGTDNVPIPGVNVIVVNTTKGTTTDFDGAYQIEVDKGDVLQFSYIGFVAQNITVGDETTIDVSLAEDLAQLDEVVVVGYGTRKKSHLTGAVAKIGGDDVAAVQVARVDDALAGKLPGVLIQNQSGEPGAAPRIQIRAASSISGDAGPLIVVDGFPISGNLATVNPNDIQSMEVLKDAASAAIYGSLGANGVILVTTKKGRSGETKFSFNSYVSVSSRYTDNILMSGPEWAAHARSEIAAGNWGSTVLNNDAAFLEYRLSAYENSPGAISPEDWLFRNGSTQNYDFSMSGGSDNSNFFASVGYQNTDGIAITQGFERINARLNVDTKLGDKFKAGLSFNGFASRQDVVAHDMRDLLRAYGVHPVYHTAESIAFVQALDAEAQALGLTGFDAGYRGGVGPTSIFELEPGDRADDWHYGRANNGIGGSGDAGPAQKLDNADQWVRTYFGNISGYLEYAITDGLTAKTILAGDFNNTQNYYWQGLASDSRARTNQTDLDQTDLSRSSVLSTTTLGYNKLLNEKHDISAVVGMEFQTRYFRGTSLNGTNVPYGLPANFSSLDPADVVKSERKEIQTRQSVFGRVQYAYDDRYMASLSVRRDGDSRFGANRRYETFPAFSLGWNIHNESFWNSEAVSLFKLRFSNGSLGTSSFLGSYQSLSTLNPYTTGFGLGFLIPSDVENADLTWQSNEETNYGIDLGFANNRFRLSVDYYTSDVGNMLINQSVTEIVGTPQIVLNVGDTRSSGLEFELSAGVVRSEDFTWDLSGNLSTVETEITKIGGLEALPNVVYGQSGRGPQFRNYVGGEIGEMWGLETIGDVEMEYLADGTRHPNNATGESYVVDQNGDGTIDSDDYVKIGQNTPDFYWGLNSSMNYKDFDFSFQFQGSHGADVYNIDPLYYESQWGGRLDYASLDANSDGIADHNGEFYERNRNQTDAVMQDASYIALRNLTIGYTINPEALSKVGISSARIYAAATNLLYIMGDDYTSYNPEGVETTNTGYQGPTTYGVQVGASPIVRSFTVGLNVNF
ncbi:TonB-dependent receptor [Seonamhaeicola sp. MEBiC1930]|uniref:SusC/RagA family TonB-linked outer membrane protein n=1 Tax=Seonamhaeicola sp. MEBiC01930 TaxID=2976768 RepID=UPI00324E1324